MHFDYFLIFFKLVTIIESIYFRLKSNIFVWKMRGLVKGLVRMWSNWWNEANRITDGPAQLHNSGFVLHWISANILARKFNKEQKNTSQQVSWICFCRGKDTILVSGVQINPFWLCYTSCQVSAVIRAKPPRCNKVGWGLNSYCISCCNTARAEGWEIRKSNLHCWVWVLHQGDGERSLQSGCEKCSIPPFCVRTSKGGSTAVSQIALTIKSC